MSKFKKEDENGVGLRTVRKAMFNADRTMQYSFDIDPNPQGDIYITLMAKNAHGGFSTVLGYIRAQRDPGDDRPEELLELTLIDDNGQYQIGFYHPDGHLKIGAFSNRNTNTESMESIKLGCFTLDELPNPIDFEATRNAFLIQARAQNFRQPILVPT